MKKLMIIVTALLVMAGYTVNAQTGHNQNEEQDQKQDMMQMHGQCGMMDQDELMQNQNSDKMKQDISITIKKKGAIL